MSNSLHNANPNHMLYQVAYITPDKTFSKNLCAHDVSLHVVCGKVHHSPCNDLLDALCEIEAGSVIHSQYVTPIGKRVVTTGIHLATELYKGIINHLKLWRKIIWN